MKTFSGRAPSQRPDEIRPLIDLMRDRGVRTYLEVGARHGDTFHEVMTSLPVGSRGVAVDLPGAAWGISSSRAHLLSAAKDLRKRGYDIAVILADSRSIEAVKAAATHGPYGAVMIDGDHRYDGVKSDWLFYGAMGSLIAFHDIDGEGRRAMSGEPVEVPRLWREIKAEGYECREFIGAERGMGIGVVLR